MKIVFFGSSKYSTIVAQTLHQAISLTAIVTLPDKPKGRRKILTPNPAKVFAEQNNIPAITADKLDKATIEKISTFKPDFLIIADYGKIIPKELLAVPKYAPLNIHHSLLPKYRGPSPATSAILSDEKISGVTVIEMNEKLDAGDILAQKKYTLKDNETTESLLSELNKIGGEIIIPVLNSYLQGKIKKTPQNEALATYTQKLEKTGGLIDVQNPPSSQQLDRMIRAYYPWPTVWTKIEINGKSKIIKLLPEKNIQVEGGKPMTIKDLLNGYPQMRDTLKNIL